MNSSTIQTLTWYGGNKLKFSHKSVALWGPCVLRRRPQCPKSAVVYVKWRIGPFRPKGWLISWPASWLMMPNNWVPFSGPVATPTPVRMGFWLWAGGQLFFQKVSWFRITLRSPVSHLKIVLLSAQRKILKIVLKPELSFN